MKWVRRIALLSTGRFCTAWALFATEPNDATNAGGCMSWRWLTTARRVATPAAKAIARPSATSSRVRKSRPQTGEKGYTQPVALHEVRFDAAASPAESVPARLPPLVRGALSQPRGRHQSALGSPAAAKLNEFFAKLVEAVSNADGRPKWKPGSASAHADVGRGSVRILSAQAAEVQLDLLSIGPDVVSKAPPANPEAILAFTLRNTFQLS
jgi:hypothetical protein